MQQLNALPIETLLLLLIPGVVLGMLLCAGWALLSKRSAESRSVQALEDARRESESRLQHLELEHQNQLVKLEGEWVAKKAGSDAEIKALQKVVESQDLELQELRKVKERYIQIETRLQDQQISNEKQARLIEEAKAQLFKEFELSAAKLFDDKQKNFAQASKQNIESVVSPFRDQLKDFHKKIDDVYHKESSQRNQLVGQIAELQKQTLKVSEDANSLATALKGDNKTQGSWGEIVLERILEESGLEKGREYEVQATYANEEGKKLRPDIIVRLPDSKDIVIDSKVSLVHFERYVNEADEKEKEKLLKSHIESLRTHVKGLSLKQYENLEGLRTLDFVFLFVPVESAYLAALQVAPEIFKEAYEKNIVLVSPSSLMVALRTVETIWRHEKQNANAEKIAASAGKLYDQFILVLGSLEGVGGYIAKAGEAYEKTLKQISEGRGNALKRVDDLKKLGAKTSRKMPEKFTEKLNLSEDLLLDEANNVDELEVDK